AFREFEVGYSVLSEFAADAQESAPIIEALGLNILRLPVLPADVDERQRPLIRLAGQAAYAMAARRLAVAEPLLDEVVETEPSTPDVHYARGVFRLTESPETAIDDFKQEIVISPTHVPARLQVAFE